MSEAPESAVLEQSIDIAADRERVWLALTNSAAVVIWDTGIVRPIDAPDDYPRPGQTVRWRYRLMGLPLTLIDRPQEVVPLERLRTHIVLAFLRLDETYTLDSSALRPRGTRLSVRLLIGNTLPVFRHGFNRWFGRRLATQTITQSLLALREFCERDIPVGT